MDTDQLHRRLRDADTDSAQDERPVDRLITRAVQRGRRRVVVRRSVTAVAGVAVLAVVAGVGFDLTGTDRLAVPAASPTALAAPSDPAPEPSSSPSGPSSGSSSASGPATDGRPVTSAEVATVFEELLPDTVSVTGMSTSSPEKGVRMTLVDEAGSVWAGGGLDGADSLDSLDCRTTAYSSCTSSAVDGGILYTTEDLEKVGAGVWYYFQRSDQRVVWLGLRAAVEGDGPTTRDGVPLTRSQVVAVLTAPAWDALAVRCADSGRIC